jgi:hypothetical protein
MAAAPFSSPLPPVESVTHSINALGLCSVDSWCAWQESNLRPSD